MALFHRCSICFIDRDNIILFEKDGMIGYDAAPCLIKCIGRSGITLPLEPISRMTEMFYLERLDPFIPDEATLPIEDYQTDDEIWASEICQFIAARLFIGYNSKTCRSYVIVLKHFRIVCLSIEKVINRTRGKVAYMRPLKLQASLRALDLARYWELVAVGHRFEKVSVLATMPSQIYLRKLEWTSNADRLKLNDWSVQIDINLIEEAFVAFVRSWLGTICETRKLQQIQTHKTHRKKHRWHTGYNPSVSTCGPTFDP